MPENTIGRDPRFPNPMHDAEQVSERTWRDGVTFTVGDLIAYDATAYDSRASRVERHEGVIAELWVEQWWGDTRELMYAEVVTAVELAERVWFHRDKVGAPMGVVGVVPEGAMF